MAFFLLAKTASLLASYCMSVTPPSIVKETEQKASQPSAGGRYCRRVGTGAGIHDNHPRRACIVPWSDGVFSGLEIRTNLWDKYSTAAPAQQN